MSDAGLDGLANVNNSSNMVVALDKEELVTVYRLPGERLGMGLRFDGGCHVSDCIERLFIQSITEQSPASRVRCKWGALQEGDMILKIQGRDVDTMTRLDCVSVLRDAPVALGMLVRHLHDSDNSDNLDNSAAPVPPVPARTRLEIRLSPQIARALQLSRQVTCLGPPVAADVYTDLIAEEEQLMMEYESDDTGSSVSTVIDHVRECDASAVQFEPPDRFKDSIVVAAQQQEGFVLQERNKFEKLLKNDVAIAKPRLKLPPRKKPCTPPPPIPTPNTEITDEITDEIANDITANDDNNRHKPPPVPPRSRFTKISSQNQNSNMDHSTTGERLLAVQSWLEDFVLANKATSAQGEETSLGSASASEPEMENDVTRPISIERSNDERATALVRADDVPLSLDKPLPQVTVLNNMAKNELLIDFAQDLGCKPSRLPPDGHEFPPSFVESNTETIVDFQDTNPEETDSNKTDKLSPCCPENPPPVVSTYEAKLTIRPNEKTSPSWSLREEKVVVQTSRTRNESHDVKPFSTLPRKAEKQNFYSDNFANSSSWYSLLESRKQQVSKLRGLVIPEKHGQNITNVIPMPTITSTDRIRRENSNKLASPFGSLPRNLDSKRDSNANCNGNGNGANNGATPCLTIPPWKDVSSSNFPKYSPAFKRKSLSILQKDAPTVSVSVSRPKSATLSSTLFDLSRFSSQESWPKPESASATAETETEDKDSVISSSGSNFSQSLSPPVSPFRVSSSQSHTDDDMVEEYVVIRITETDTHTEAAAETETGNKEKVERKSSVEALNRRNVLERAKFSSGGADEAEQDETDGERAKPDVVASPPATFFHYRSHSDIVCKSRVDVKTKPNAIKSFRQLAEQWESKKTELLPTSSQARRKSLPVAAFRPVPTQTSQSSQIPVRAVKDRDRSFSVENGQTPKATTPQRYGNKGPSTSVGDLLKIFEQQQQQHQQMLIANGKVAVAHKGAHQHQQQHQQQNHARMSSQDSTASESEVFSPAHYGSVNSLSSIAHDQFGSISSLASSTSLISPQELQQLLDDANQSLEESGTPQHEILVVVLHREIAGGNIGITLAGGADYEAKEITVHKVINGSLADRDGRIQKGDRVISINGKNVKGITHKEALNLLKAPRPECVLVLSRNTLLEDIKKSSPLLKDNIIQPVKVFKKHNRDSLSVQLVKDGGGLGFSLDGGRESPAGDKPLTIKKVFLGGSADKCELLKIGDEIIAINGTDVSNMSRIEAWTMIKKLPEGKINVAFRQA